MKKSVIVFFFLTICASYKGACQHFEVENTSTTYLANFNGAQGMFVIFSEDGVRRGYIGSFSGDAEDFDLGTSSLNPTGDLNLTIKGDPKLTIDQDGNVSVMSLNSTNQGPVYSNSGGSLSTEKLQYSMISAVEFVGDSYIATTLGGTPEAPFFVTPVYAAVHLPDGAVIKRIDVIYTDNNSGSFSNIEVSFKEKPYNSNTETNLYTFSSSGANPGILTALSGLLSLSPISNFTKAYFIEITFPVGLALDPYLISIVGVRIYFSY